MASMSPDRSEKICTESWRRPSVPGRLVLEVFLLPHPSNDAHVTTYTGQPVSLRFASIAPPRCCSGVRLLCGLTLKRCVLAVGLRAYARDRDGNKVKIVLTSTRMHMSQLWSWKLPCHVTAVMTTWAADTIYSLLCGSSPRERSGVQVVSLPGASSVISWVPSLSDKTQRVCPVLAATQNST